MTLGYTIPFEEDILINNARVYVTAQNPFISQDFSGFTPELPGAPLDGAGIEFNAYPAVRSFIVGVDLSL